MNRHEEMFARHFVNDSKRERYLEQFTSEKGRKKLVAELDHCLDLDDRCCTPMPRRSQTPALIRELLTAKGASNDCHVLSSNAELDGQNIDLQEALEQTVGYGYGTFISCIPGQLGYFESSEPHDGFILERR